jgi:hypothetical protein
MKKYILRPPQRQMLDTKTREIMETLAETIEELSLLTEATHNEHMAEINSDTEIIVNITPRIEERYTAFHLIYYAETADITDIG